MILPENFKSSISVKRFSWKRNKIVFLLIFIFHISSIFANSPQNEFEFDALNLQDVLNPQRDRISDDNQKNREQKRRAKLFVEQLNKFMKVLKDKETLEIFLKQESRENIQFLLQVAVSSSSVNTIRYILENSSVDINAKSNLGVPLVHLALMRQNQNIDVIKVFLNYPGIDFFAVNEWGDNLFHAIFLSGKRTAWLSNFNLLFEHKNFKMFSELLNATNVYGETPMDFFIRELTYSSRIPDRYFYDIFQALYNKGARYTVKWENIENRVEKLQNLQQRFEQKSENGVADKSSCKNAWIY